MSIISICINANKKHPQSELKPLYLNELKQEFQISVYHSCR